MKNWIVQIIVILVISAAIGLAINSARGGGVAIIGNWPSRTAENDGPVVPPSAEPGDPPFVTLEDAVAMYQSQDMVFVDSRSPEDFQYGHIKGAINIPFDELDDTWEAFIDGLNPDDGYVVYCSGGECETSLFMGRYLNQRGFSNVFVFYGGWQEWEDNGLPIIGEEVETAGENQ